MAIKALQRYSQAERGHRTMVDALIPAQEAFSEAVDAGASCFIFFGLHLSRQKLAPMCFMKEFTAADALWLELRVSRIAHLQATSTLGEPTRLYSLQGKGRRRH